MEDPFNAINVGYDDMKHWEFAAHNLKMLNDKGITFAITSDDLKDASKLSAMLEKAVEAGLSEDVALKALTHTPAQLLNVQNDLGSLTNGKVANL